MDTDHLDSIRRGVLARMERAERNMKLGIFAAALCELLLFGLALFMFDMTNRVERLIFVTSTLSYTILVLGFVVLGAHVTRTVGRILTVVDGEHHTP